MSNKNYPKRKRKMSEKTKFKLALKSHTRLAKYHSEQYQKTEYDIHWLKSGYHNDVVKHMNKKKRRLTQDEKKEIYSVSSFYTWN